MRHLEYPRRKTLHCCPSDDAHFDDWVGGVLFLVVPMKHANTSDMTICNLWPLKLPKMQD